MKKISCWLVSYQTKDKNETIIHLHIGHKRNNLNPKGLQMCTEEFKVNNVFLSFDDLINNEQ